MTGVVSCCCVSLLFAAGDGCGLLENNDITKLKITKAITRKIRNLISEKPFFFFIS